MDVNTILLIDDDAHLLSFYKLILEEHGYRVLCLASSKGLDDMLKQHSLSLVITDLVMPEYDGMEAIFEVLSLYSIPVIALSAYRNYLQLVEQEVSLSLYKPIEAEELVNAVTLFVPIK